MEGQRRSLQDAFCRALESSITDAEQELCPAVAQRSSDVTVEEYADTVDLVIGKAEQLFACPSSGSTVPYKTKVCDFIERERAYVTAISTSVRVLASSALSCPARAHGCCRVHDTV